ncbi:MAG: DUF4249 domain-containing protein [Bacteroidales bacterium]|nr:DUF4249 domain-containing protein [Bacteroidales bacterium]
MKASPQAVKTTGKARRTRSLAKGFVSLMMLLLFFAQGCVDMVVNIDFPDQDPKLVVHSFISPADTAVMVLLSWSTPYSKPRSDGSIAFVPNAHVRLTAQSGQSTQLTFDPQRNLYRVSTHEYPIVPETYYDLLAEVPGKATATARAYIPAANPTLRFIKTDTIQRDYYSRIMVEYAFTDIPGTGENFYAPSAYRDYYYIDWISDSILYSKYKMHTVYGEEYFSNLNKEGNDFIIKAEGDLHYYWDPDENDEFEEHIHLLLLVTDEHYFRYHRSLMHYDPDNFFTESIHIYSNVEGGLGVFAGFNPTYLLVE